MKGIQNPIKNYEYIVAIGTSTGGPKALTKVLSGLDKTLSATYVVVQHMPAGFTKSLAERLNTLSDLTVKEGESEERLQQGTVYIAPGGKQLKLRNVNQLELILTDEEAYKGHKPSVNVMLNSLQILPPHQKLIVVIMTGMGSDGLEGVQLLKKDKNMTVIAQDETTSTVFGMPKAIVQAELANYIVPVDEIAKTIKTIMGE